MNTALIKTFAINARTSLLMSIENRLKFWGIKPDGNHGTAPQKSGAGYLYGGKVYDDISDVPDQWLQLAEKVRTKEQYQDLIEEAAYTWFNRIMIIKIMEKNQLHKPTLAYSEGTTSPVILRQAKEGQHTLSTASDQKLLAEALINNDDERALGLIIKDLFESNAVLNAIFGTTPEYFNLLLPTDLLSAKGLIHQINVDAAIEDEMYREVELIGWIYQFYISDKKDEVFKGFKKNKKARAKDIPAATQIFTPKWIVKYMVENTVGKIYLDYNPDSDLRSEMKYLVESEESRTSKSNSLISDITELTLIDPASGSGHILVEGFDLLIKMYKEEGYSTKQAARSILENNLYGLDIDDRAMQLAKFAVLLKASQFDPSLLKSNYVNPHIFSFPEPISFNTQDLHDFIGEALEEEKEAFVNGIELLKQGKNIGSALKVDLSQTLLDKITSKTDAWNANNNLNLQQQALWNSLKNYLNVLLLLSQKYTSVVANPPYMGQKSMNPQLKDYVNKYYPETKSDLMTVFMDVIPKFTKDNSKFALINLPSWLFLSSFEKLRKRYIKDYAFDSLLHMGRGIFGIDFGSTAFVISKTKDSESLGNYFRLHERNFQHIYYEDIEKLFLYSNGNESYKYDFKSYRDESGTADIPIEGTENGMRLYHHNIPQSNFPKIPGSPIAYWLSQSMLNIFSFASFKDTYSPATGMQTGDNKRFVRSWQEVSIRKMNSRWFPFINGGDRRKWYGNFNDFILWEDSGSEIKGHSSSVIRNKQFYLSEGGTWNRIASTGFSSRYFPKGFVFDQAGDSFFYKSGVDINFGLAFLNTIVALKVIEILCPTLNVTAGNIASFPFNNKIQNNSKILGLVSESINISKKDWDSRETSWDFDKSPLLKDSVSLSKTYEDWFKQVSEDFFQLHANEEELNRIFIDIFGLQDELSQEVALKDITILQEELDRKELEALELTFREKGKDAIQLPLDKAIVMSQFMSYCMGLSMGRYRLDKDCLQIAHPNPTQEELSNYKYNDHTIDIDDDAIIPLLGDEGNFPDDALLRTKNIILAIWGEESHTDNMNFLQECLGMPLQKWFTVKFWSYHSKTMYKKKPIYWLFCSNPKKPQKAAFRVLTYMHRMDKYTVQNIRTKYLHPHQEYIQSQIADLESNEASLSKDEAKKLDLMRQVWRPELMDYDDKLKPLANEQIIFDLDDGVTENYKLFEGVVAEIK